MPKNNVPLPRQLVLRGSSGQREIASTQQAEEEAHKERQFWETLEARLKPVLPDGIDQKLHIGWKLLFNSVAAGDAGFTQLAATYARAAVNCYEREICFGSDSKLAKDIKQHVDSGSYEQAATLLDNLKKRDNPLEIPHPEAGPWMYLPESLDATSGVISEMEASAKQANVLLEEMLGYTQAAEKLQSSLAETKTAGDNLREDTANLQKAVEEAISNAQANAVAGIALEQPVEFWQERSKEHRLWTKVSFCVFLGVCAALISLVAIYFNEVKTLLQPPANATSSDYLAEYVFILITFGIPAFLVFWILRIIYRVYVTQQQLGNDARERETMMRTYLALAKGQHVSKDDLHLALRSLFRPHTEVAVDDTPPTLVEAIAAQLRSTK
ncbi:MAG: DUF6161 domain-containing protein [Parvibaculum sp.]|uniref:DUF6161 domain-containing protein n=1 Tax=Parvibaculum sp. TaxID=2024848 RepID=UPI0032EBEC11